LQSFQCLPKTISVKQVFEKNLEKEAGAAGSENKNLERIQRNVMPEKISSSQPERSE